MIPKLLLEKILNDKYYRVCVRYKEGVCKGRITFEHVWIYAGKQIQEKWAIIPLCEYHHNVCNYQDRGDLQKEVNQFYSLQRVKDNQLVSYPRKNWKQIRKYLNDKYEKNY